MRTFLHIRNACFYFVAVTALVMYVSCKSTQKSQNSAPAPIVVQPPAPLADPVPTIKEVSKDVVKQLKVALIMPFELNVNFGEVTDEILEPQISPSSLPSLNFLEGAQIAIDSLKLLKREVKITAYDTPPDSIGVVRMLTNPEFKEANMVIGTFPNSLVNAAIGAAKMANVNLLLTQAGTTSVLDNYANTALAFASTITQCRGMVSFTMAQYPDSKVILVYRTTKREDELAAIYKDEILKDKQSHEFVEHKSIEKGDKEIAALLSKTKRNVIFLISSDEAFISPVLSLFEEQNIFGVMVAGLPTWQNFESIDFMSMKYVQVMLFDNNFISYDAPERSVFRKAFISKYQNDPLNAAYNGFDIVFKMGIGFENREQKFQNWIRKSFPESTSDFNFIGDGFGGMENKFISVLKFNDYNLERINLK